MELGGVPKDLHVNLRLNEAELDSGCGISCFFNLQQPRNEWNVI